MAYEYAIADVFTDRCFGGNQLAVVLEAQGLSTKQMQAIAREFNFAETTFVLPPDEPGATARLRIFTPGAEMPFAGHPTVGSAAVLAALDRVPVAGGAAQIVFTEQVGPVDVSVTGVGAALAAELRLAAVLSKPAGGPEVQGAAAALGLPRDAVLEAWCAGVGMTCAFARLASVADLEAARIDPAGWPPAMAGGPSPILYFFAGDLVDGACVDARMFAPDLGVPEDPATGAAVAALVACVAERDGRPDATVALTVRQGHQMGRPSFLHASARTTAGHLEYVTVGGGVALFATGVIDATALG